MNVLKAYARWSWNLFWIGLWKQRSSLCSQLSQRWGVFEFRVYNELDSNCFNARACTNSSAGFSWKCSWGLIQILLKWKTLADLSGLWIRSMEKCFYEKNAFTVALIQQGIWACTQSSCMCLVVLAHSGGYCYQGSALLPEWPSGTSIGSNLG